MKPGPLPVSGLLSVFTVSAAVLAYEVLLMRLFAIVQWHHFAYMAISVALLGFGASGSFLFLARGWLKTRYTAAFAVNAALFGVTGLAGFALAQQVPFNALEVLWRPRQLLNLGVLYGLFVVPFFAGANCIGLALSRDGARIGAVYAANLVGSGLGALAVIGVLFLITPDDALRLIAAGGLLAAALACLAGSARRAAAALGLAAVVLPLLVPVSWLEPRLSPYKSLSRALAVKDAELVDTASGPLGLVSLVRSPTVPFRHLPGLSISARGEIPEQLGLFTDGDGLTAITSVPQRLEELTVLDQTAGALPYHLLQRPSVLILGAGGGTDVLQALHHRARSVDAVELDVNVIGFAGAVYRHPRVRVHAAEARAFVAATGRRWDLIQIPLLDSSAAAAAGVHALSKSYVYTVEALRDYLRRLNPGGILAITRWLKLPPRDSLKLFATARTALHGAGVADPAARLVLMRSWNTTVLMVRNGDFTPDDVATLRTFAADRSFDLAFFPGIRRDQANRFNILPQPYFHDGAVALAQGRPCAAGYKFDIRPASDDRPYFFDFFKWRSLREIIQLHRRGGITALELGYPVLMATLAQAVLLGLVLILLPLAAGGERRVRAGRTSLRILAYFACLGLAFLFVEIAFIQRFVLFLGHPLTAVVVVLCAFLVFAGAGSAAGARLSRWAPPRLGPVFLPVAAIAVLSSAYAGLLPSLLVPLAALPAVAKIPVALALVAPLAFFMGMPFPLGLARVAAARPALVPWAWGVNGCCSVISAVLATVLAIHFGFTVVVAIAAVLYLAAGALFRAPLDAAD